VNVGPRHGDGAGYPAHALAGRAAYVLVGPTAVGKTAVAHALAAADGMDILSADSMLVYRGMDIGTAKPTRRQRREVVYRGLDLVEPGDSFSAGQYLAQARRALRQAARNRRIQIVVGGTGLYVKGLLQGMGGSRPADPAVRAQVLAWYRAEGLQGLARRLQETAPDWHRRIGDLRNPRRVQRALEYALAGAPPPRGWQERAAQTVVGLSMARDALRRRITQRVDAMYDGGLLDEAAAMQSRPGGISSTASGAIGYAEALDLLAGRCTPAEARSRTAVRTRQLAKRQMTWFRRQLSVHWIEVAPEAATAEIADRVRAAWRGDGPTTLFSGESRDDEV
jgi:tRNA dimethylallyltransferase